MKSEIKVEELLKILPQKSEIIIGSVLGLISILVAFGIFVHSEPYKMLFIVYGISLLAITFQKITLVIRFKKLLNQ